MAQIVEKPWHLRDRLKQLHTSDACVKSIRYDGVISLLTTADSSLYCSVSGKKIIGPLFFWKGCGYRIFPLLGPAFEGDGVKYEVMQITTSDQSVTNKFSLTYKTESSAPEVESFDALLNTAYHFRRNILQADNAQPPVVDWLRALSEIKRHEDNDKARQASIVDMAYELPVHLEKVVRQPRRILNRVRNLERIQRVREVDKACLINLARRPGIGIAEKAGPSQRILAVCRQETNDTLENRVTRHCCVLIRRATDHYLALHHDVAEDSSPRMQAVHKLQSKAIVWGRSETFSRVTALTSPCKSPNYVLLQNPHYMRIWNAYRVLVKNEEVRANVWRWKQQLWKEVATIGFSQLFSSCVTSLSPDEYPVNISVSEERIIGAERGFSQGRFLNQDTLPGPFILGASKMQAGTLYLVDSMGLQAIDRDTSSYLMNADFYIVGVTRAGRKIIPVYCLSQETSLNDKNIEADDVIQHLTRDFPEMCGVIFLRSAPIEAQTTITNRHRDGRFVLNINLSISPKNWMLNEVNDLSTSIQRIMR